MPVRRPPKRHRAVALRLGHTERRVAVALITALLVSGAAASARAGGGAATDAVNCRRFTASLAANNVAITTNGAKRTA